jgi:hypothetical protein
MEFALALAATLITALATVTGKSALSTRTPPLETDCVAGHIGLELRCAERKFISLRCRVSSDSGAPAETAAVPRENDLLC